MNRIFRNTIFYLLIFLVVIGVVSFFNGTNQRTEPMTYDAFITHLENGDVKSFSIKPERGVYEIKGQLKTYSEGQYFSTYVMNSDKVLDRIDAAAARTRVEVVPADETSGWVTFFTSIIPFVIIFILFFFLLNQAQAAAAG